MSIDPLNGVLSRVLRWNAGRDSSRTVRTSNSCVRRHLRWCSSSPSRRRPVLGWRHEPRIRKRQAGDAGADDPSATQWHGGGDWDPLREIQPPMSGVQCSRCQRLRCAGETCVRAWHQPSPRRSCPCRSAAPHRGWSRCFAPAT